VLQIISSPYVSQSWKMVPFEFIIDPIKYMKLLNMSIRTKKKGIFKY
jgi:hypothetical protein